MADTKLAELQEKKNAAYLGMKEAREKHPDKKYSEWPADVQAAYDRAEAAHDEAAAARDARHAELISSKDVDEDLKRIESERRTITKEAKIGLDEEKRRKENPEHISKIDTRALALQAWMRSEAGMELTEEHRTACRTLKVNPAAKEIGFPDYARYDHQSKPSFCSRGRQARREFRVGLDVATSGAGLETIPQGFMYELEAVTLEYAHVRQVCRVIHTDTGNALPWPKVDDTGNTGVLLAEATTFGTSVDPTFSAVTFNAYKYSSKPVFVSYEILRDSAFNLGSLIAGMLGERLGRIEGSETSTANGSAKPLGIVSAAGTGVTSVTAAAFTADELIDLVHSLDPSNRYGASVGFMFHDTCLKYVRKFKDANGQYLWAPGMMAGEQDTLYGYPVAINQAMEPLVSNVPVTAKKHVLFGDFSKFVIRDVATPRFKRLDERYADTDQVAFIAFKELDSDTIKASALKVLLQA